MGLNVYADVGKICFFVLGWVGVCMVILVFSAVSQLVVDAVEEAGVSDLSGRWWSVQICSQSEPPNKSIIPYKSMLDSKGSHFCIVGFI